MYPEGWSEQLLGSVSRIVTGGTPSRSQPDYWGGDIPWMSSGEVNQRTVRQVAERITMLGMTNSNARLLPLNTIMMAMNGQGKTRGKVAILKIETACNQSLAGIIPDDKIIGADYLFHYLDSLYRDIRNITGDDARNGLNLKIIASINIVLPPRDEQGRIAEVLQSIDEAIAAQDRVCRQLSDVFDSTLEACFTARDWPAHSLESLCESIQVGIVVRPASYYVDTGGVPALRSLNVLENRLALGDLVYISEAGHASNQKSSLRAGDVVTRRTGEPGKTAMIPAGFDDGLNCIDIIFSRPKAHLRPAYMSFFMNSQAAKRQVTGLQGGLAQQHLNVSEMKTLKVPLPDLQIQDDTVAILDAIRANVEAEQYLLDRLILLGRSVRSDLLSGRVRVPASIETHSKPSVQPAFKRAVFAAEIVHQLHNDARFGSVKHEKIVHLCELHIGLQKDLDRHAYKEAAGPYDPKARRSVEAIFRQQKWFNAAKPDGKRVVYQPLENCGGHASYFQRYFGDRQAEVQTMIDLLRPMNTQQCEIVATLYAVWNDFLIDGRQASDAEIVASVLNDWHSSKAQIAEDRWLAALPWMRKHGLTPKGLGEKTRVVAT